MAFPQISTSIATETTGTTHTINYPTGTINSGDLLVCCFTTDGDNTVTNWDVTDDWTELLSLSNGADVFEAVAWRKADGDESSSSFQVTTSDNERGAAVVYCITGAADPTVTPPEGDITSGDSSTPDPPIYNTEDGTKDYLWIATCGVDTDDVTGYPYADNQIKGYYGSNQFATVAACTDELTGQEQNPGTFTISGDEWVAATIAVHPAPSGNQYYQSCDGSFSATGNITKKAMDFKVSGIFSATGAIIKKDIIKLGLAGVFTATGTVTKITTFLKSLSGSFDMAGMLGATKIILKSLEGAFDMTGSILKTIDKKGLGGSLNMTGAILKAISKKGLSGIFSATGDITKKAIIKLGLSGGFDFSGNLSTTLVFLQTVTGIFSATGNITNYAIKKSLSGIFTASGAVTNFIIGKNLAGIFSATGSILKHIMPSAMGGDLNMSGSISTSLTLLKSLAGAMGPLAGLLGTILNPIGGEGRRIRKFIDFFFR